MAKDVIIACDFASKEQLLDFLEQFGSERPYLKIGMELFYAQGVEIVKLLKARGHKIFLDLKLHDIPNTVAKTTSFLADLGVDMLNLHAAGGSEMMKAAQNALSDNHNNQTQLIAVTQLTSISQNMLEQELLIKERLEKVVLSYARNARDAGLAGIVCSAWEAELIHQELGADFLTVTPGIRFAGAAKDDQVRIMTPAKARAVGSDYIVVGRAITASDNPLTAYQKCRKDFLSMEGAINE